MSKGYVYILSNPSMPGLVKIGKTTRSVEHRASEIDTTGVPEPFVIVHEFTSPDCHELEATAHQELSDYRVRQGREFFRVPPDEALKIINNLLLEQVSEWLDDFLPCHSIVEDPYIIDPADVVFQADRAGLDPYSVAASYHLISSDEIKAAAQKFESRLSKSREEKKPDLKVMP